MPVYPRECGGTSPFGDSGRWRVGLSPRVRRNRFRIRRFGVQKGSIPASAGEPRRAPAAHSDRRVYPRECGGTYYQWLVRPCPLGLSPRVRGNPESIRRAGILAGSIPASAGEPTGTGSRPRPRRVYPRECGGTERTYPDHSDHLGLSPRVRGNPLPPGRVAEPGRSIPASAGEPGPSVAPRRACWVYPRECGGTHTPSPRGR